MQLAHSFLNYGADVDLIFGKPGDEIPLLHHALYRRDIAAAKFLMENSCLTNRVLLLQLNIVAPSNVGKGKNLPRRSALHIISATTLPQSDKDDEEVEHLFDLIASFIIKGANLNLLDEYDNTTFEVYKQDCLSAVSGIISFLEHMATLDILRILGASTSNRQFWENKEAEYAGPISETENPIYSPDSQSGYTSKGHLAAKVVVVRIVCKLKLADKDEGQEPETEFVMKQLQVNAPTFLEQIGSDEPVIQLI
ncbi:unnamed protein product [Protopolystoma xenopodis]|uniref:Uncharacterized protein n=1 Tax=Protopolystoma xenopodis TaxID=117903 RepID=A0A448WHV6_9PLAT|nr:unnamed protein product [Protopolystoma xenopodis]